MALPHSAAAASLTALLLLLCQITEYSHAYGNAHGSADISRTRHYWSSWQRGSPSYNGQAPYASSPRENEVYKLPDSVYYGDKNDRNLRTEIYQDQRKKRPLKNGNDGVPARQISERPRHPPLDRPTLRPAGNFNAQEDAAKLRKALGKIVSEDVVISIMTKRTDDQRQEIGKNYPNLKKDLGWKLSFGFRELMKALATPLHEFQAEQLKEAFRFSTRIDEDIVIELLCTLNNRQLRKVREGYQRLTRKDLNNELAGFSLNHFAKFLISYTQGNRDERSAVDTALATYDAQQLKSAGKLSIDNNTPFKKILISRSFPQLRLTFTEYKRITGRNIKDAIRTDFTDNTQKGLLNIVKTINNRANYFAEILNSGIRTFSKRDATLIRVMVIRAEIDMEDIKSSYNQLYNIPLTASIPTNTGTMKKALLSLIS